ncbi:MAG: LysR substrate-binding domain-containing protein [Dehalococcoidia bacterium]
MNLQQLRVFAAVADLGSFTRAAETLYLSQSGVSQHIETLEREQGVRLIDRLGRHVQLTDAGAILLPYAHRLINLEREAEESLAIVKGLGAGHLRVGASPTPATYLLPYLLGIYHRRNPAVEILLAVDVTLRIAEQVAAGALGAGLVEGDVHHDQLQAQPCLHDELLVVTQPDIRPADGQAFHVEELAVLRQIAREPGSLTRRLIEQTFGRCSLPYRPVIELGHMEAIKQAVAAGLGVSILSGYAVANEIQRGRLNGWRVHGLPFRRIFLLLTRKGNVGSPATDSFLNLMNQERDGCAALLKQVLDRTPQAASALDQAAARPPPSESQSCRLDRRL